MTTATLLEIKTKVYIPKAVKIVFMFSFPFSRRETQPINVPCKIKTEMKRKSFEMHMRKALFFQSSCRS